MDSIYSRKRINIPKIKGFYTKNNNKNKKNGKNAENENTAYENEDPEEFVQVLDDGTKLNTSDKLSETKTFENYERIR